MGLFKDWLKKHVKEYIDELNRPHPLEEARKNLSFANVEDSDTSKFTKSIQEFARNDQCPPKNANIAGNASWLCIFSPFFSDSSAATDAR
jgi:hypothetical protein